MAENAEDGPPMSEFVGVAMTPRQRSLLERGAELAGVTISELVRSATLEAAREEIVEAEIAKERTGS